MKISMMAIAKISLAIIVFARILCFALCTDSALVSLTSKRTHFISVATKPHPRLEILRKSFTENNETITFLEMGSSIPLGWGTGGFGLKMQALFAYIHSDNVRSDDLIVNLDAYDTFYCGTTAELESRFVSMDKEVVFGAERFIWPDRDRKYPDSDLKEYFPYLNSGLFIGRVSALRELMEGYDFDPKEDDQRYWTTKYLERPDLIELDHDNLIFLNCAGIDISELTYINRAAHFRMKNPLIVHGNGDDKSCLGKFNL